MEPADVDIPEALRWAAQNFNVDQVTAEVTQSFTAAGIESILLKGPTIATWLYANDRPRLYADSDLLIQRGDWTKAQDVMRELGFDDGLAGLQHPRMESGAGYPWGRHSDQAQVDLHCTLFGLDATSEQVWDALTEGAKWDPVGGDLVRTPSYTARLVHITIHAVQHGGERDLKLMANLERRPMMDLERAVELVPPTTWAEAHELAGRLGGASVFAAGLSLLPSGRELAHSIGVRKNDSSAETTLRLKGVPLSEGFAQLAAADGFRARLVLVVREAFPTPSFMRWWKPLARRGRVGLALTYVWRVFWLAYRAFPGFLAWRRATRGAEKNIG